MIDPHLLTSGVIFGLSMGSIFFLVTVGLSLPGVVILARDASKGTLARRTAPPAGVDRRRT